MPRSHHAVVVSVAARRWTNGSKLAIRLRRIRPRVTLPPLSPAAYGLTLMNDKDLDKRAAEQAKDVIVALKLAAVVICGLLFVEWLCNSV